MSETAGCFVVGHFGEKSAFNIKQKYSVSANARCRKLAGYRHRKIALVSGYIQNAISIISINNGAYACWRQWRVAIKRAVLFIPLFSALVLPVC